jgi:putative transposase
MSLQEEYGPVAQQRCWMHKTANVLDKMPKSVQGEAKQLIHEMYMAPTRKAALAAYDQFISSYQIKFTKACECLEKDKEVLFTGKARLMRPGLQKDLFGGGSSNH